MNLIYKVVQLRLPEEAHDKSIPHHARRELKDRCHEAHQELCQARLADWTATMRGIRDEIAKAAG
jgi:hypothetical protein